MRARDEPVDAQAHGGRAALVVGAVNPDARLVVGDVVKHDLLPVCGLIPAALRHVLIARTSPCYQRSELDSGGNPRARDKLPSRCHQDKLPSATSWLRAHFRELAL